MNQVRVFFFSRLQFLFCISYCLIGTNELIYVGIGQVFFLMKLPK